MNDPIIIGDATLYRGDALEILPTLAAGSVDVVVTDPPYGTAVEVRRVKGVRILGDDDTVMRDAALLACPDIPMMVFGSPKMPRPKGTRFVVIWDKGELVGMGDLRFPWKLTHEEINIIGDGFSRGRRTGSVVRFPLRMPWTKHKDAVTGSHPAEKPLGLMRWCLSFLPDSATVLDPFMGSGTTGVACAHLGRKFIGIEIDPGYFDVACRRIEDAMTGGPLLKGKA